MSNVSRSGRPRAPFGQTADRATVAAATSGVGAAVVAAVAGACCVGPVVAPIFVSVLRPGPQGSSRTAPTSCWAP